MSRKERQISTYEQENLLLARMLNLNTFSLFFYLYLSKSNNGSAILNCCSLTEFRFNINERLTQLAKYGGEKKRLCVHLQIYQQGLNSWRIFGIGMLSVPLWQLLKTCLDHRITNERRSENFYSKFRNSCHCWISLRYARLPRRF